MQQCVALVAEKTKYLYDKYKKPVWIGTPLVAPPTQSGDSHYIVDHTETVYSKITNHMTTYINDVSSELRSLGLDFGTCVKGIYISDEGIFDTFDFSTSVASHPQVKMFQAISDFAATKGKQMLWSPYWSTANLVKAAHIVHRTNIFDYVLMQPGYYFRKDNDAVVPAANYKLNCEAIRAMIIKQRVCYQNEQQILHDSNITCGRATISCQMEIDQLYVTDAAQFGPHYDHYEEIFGKPVTGYTKANANFGFYFGCPAAKNDPDFDTIREKVNAFFGDDTAK